jgi:hypothetical protein
MEEISYLEKEIIKLKHQNIKLLKIIEDYKELLLQYKQLYYRIPDLDELDEVFI